jgi:phosphoribosylformylglycinamidine synthase
VRAAQACRDVSLAYRTPFISGKDSLNNEYTHEGRSLSIPPTLLISAIGIVPDVRAAVTMDLKAPGNALYLLGSTRRELGGSLWAEVNGRPGGIVPRVDLQRGPGLVRALHQAMRLGLIRSCHDLSEGGLAVALAEMALAGGLGAAVSLDRVPCDEDAADPFVLLFSESPTRFVLEVAPEDCGRVEQILGACPLGRLGEVGRRGGDAPGSPPRLSIEDDGSTIVGASLDDLKEAWKSPLRWS